MIRDINVNSILRGWFNWAMDQIGMLSHDVKMLAEKRLKICETCKERKDNKCSLCGCILPAKAADPQAKCQISKW